MAIGDLTAEEQVLFALGLAHEALIKQHPSQQEREGALAEIREALKRIQEARHA